MCTPLHFGRDTELITIDRSELIDKFSSVDRITAYRFTNGSDVKSLHAYIACSEWFYIKDAKKKKLRCSAQNGVAEEYNVWATDVVSFIPNSKDNSLFLESVTVLIDWSRFKLNSSSFSIEKICLFVEGVNYSNKKQFEVKFEILTPKIQFVRSENSEWGENEIGIIEFSNPELPEGSQKWWFQDFICLGISQIQTGTLQLSFIEIDKSKYKVCIDDYGDSVISKPKNIEFRTEVNGTTGIIFPFVFQAYFTPRKGNLSASIVDVSDYEIGKDSVCVAKVRLVNEIPNSAPLENVSVNVVDGENIVLLKDNVNIPLPALREYDVSVIVKKDYFRNRNEGCVLLKTGNIELQIMFGESAIKESLISRLVKTHRPKLLEIKCQSQYEFWSDEQQRISKVRIQKKGNDILENARFFYNGDETNITNELNKKGYSDVEVNLVTLGEMKMSATADFSQPDVKQVSVIEHPIKFVDMPEIRLTDKKIFFTPDPDSAETHQIRFTISRSQIEQHHCARSSEKLVIADDAPYIFEANRREIDITSLNEFNVCVEESILADAFSAKQKVFPIVFTYVCAKPQETFTEKVTIELAPFRAAKDYYQKVNVKHKQRIEFPTDQVSKSEGEVMLCCLSFESKHLTKQKDEYQRRNERFIIENKDGFFSFDDGSLQTDLGDDKEVRINLNISKQFPDMLNVDNEKRLGFDLVYECDFPKERISKPFNLVVLPCVREAIKFVEILDNNNNVVNISNNVFNVSLSYDSAGLKQVRNMTIAYLRLANGQTALTGDRAEFNIVVKTRNVTLGLGDETGGKNNKYVVIIPNGGKPVDVPVLFDVQQDPTCFGKDFPMQFDIEVDRKPYKLLCKFVKVMTDNIYSLDLGTAGIVMFRYSDEGDNFLPSFNAIKLSDNQNGRIETDNNIVSSHVLLHNGVAKLSPERIQYNDSNNFLFVPSKFVVGQKVMPFISGIEGNVANVRFDIFGSGAQGTKDSISENGTISTDKYVACVYKDIIKRIPECDRKDIGELVLTYPNTYTPTRISQILEIVRSSLKLRKENVFFVPESDAVVAYYVNKRICDGGFKTIKQGTAERIVIFDMGAGTTDLSYFEIMREEGNVFQVYVKKRIGVPVAGNYLDYCIYSYLKTNDCMEKSNAVDLRKIWVSIKKLKEFMISDNYQKKIYGVLDNVKNQAFMNVIKSQCDKKVEELLDEGGELDKCLQFLTEGLLQVLFDGDINYKNHFDTLVLSGRGCLFYPFRKKIKEIYGAKVDCNTISQSEFKTCVASGALRYLDVFRHSESSRFRILSNAHFLNYGMVYMIMDEDGKYAANYLNLFEPSKINADDVKPVEENGLMTYDYSVKSLSVDLSNSKLVIFVRSPFMEDVILNYYNDLMKSQSFGEQYDSDNLKYCLIDEICRFRDNMYSWKTGKSMVDFSLDRNNNISIKIDNAEYVTQYAIPNVENDPFFRKSFMFNLNKE